MFSVVQVCVHIQRISFFTCILHVFETFFPFERCLDLIDIFDEYGNTELKWILMFPTSQ